MRVCAVDGCERSVGSRSQHPYCSKHLYRFLRHGSPTGGRTPPGATKEFFENVVKPYRGEECLIWPFARTGAGYGHMMLGGKFVLISRLACEAINGPAPDGMTTAAHNCGNGHLGCCAPNHLRWATPKENSADLDKHGTRLKGEQCPAARLTRADVDKIRSVGAFRSMRELAATYGVTPSNIRAILRWETWR